MIFLLRVCGIEMLLAVRKIALMIGGDVPVKD